MAADKVTNEQLLEKLNEVLAEQNKLKRNFSNQIDTVEMRIKGVESGIGSLDTRLSSIDSKLITVNERLEKIEKRLEAIEEWVPVANSGFNTAAS